jgi:pimeloyl-ACP methyl ester carboxylesterase
MSDEVVPFHVEVPEADLEDLRRRLRDTRWPEPATVADWSQGVPLEYLRELCRYWAGAYDWRATEKRLNALPQYRTTIDGLPIHFIHVRSPHRNAMPLVLTHGWPGSVIEFLKVIGPLTDPAANGGNAADAFHVVCPSLPGYGFSGKPAQPGWGIERIAAAWAELMRRLGYDRYGAAGSDWGTSISASLGQQDPGHVAGIHLIPPLAPPDPSTSGNLTAQERAALVSLRRSAESDSGYSKEQATRPQTIGYGLVDSPSALCAWIIEKFWAWTDSDGNPENVLTRDELLDNVMLYWLPGNGASAARLYWESGARVSRWITGPSSDTVTVPVGCSIFPTELQRPSRRWAARRFPDIRYWNEPAKGGHFAAFEQPALFTNELRSFFRLVR